MKAKRLLFLYVFISILPVGLFASCTRLYFETKKPLEMIGYENVIVSDTVWKPHKSPYRIEKNLFVLPEATLTIEPGVTVILDPGVRITSQGRIVARGTKKRPIRFGGSGSGAWEVIECFGGRLAESGTPPENVFHHCRVRGGKGITVRAGAADIRESEFHGNISSPIRLEFSRGTIAGNRVYGNSTENDTASGNGAGIMVYTDKVVTIRDNSVYDNRSAGGRDGGGGIYAFAYDRGEVAVLYNRVFRNRSDRNGGGIVAYSCRVEGNEVAANETADSGGGIYAIQCRLNGNRVYGNRAKRGGGVYAENTDIETNLVYGNAASAGMGGALYYYGNGRIANNTFEQTGRINPNPGALVVSGSPRIAANNIVATGIALRVQSHSLNTDLEAGGNYWGTADPEGIDVAVHDWLDDTAVGLVNWQGYMSGPVDGAPPLPHPVIPPASAPRAGKNALAGRITEDTVVGGAKRPYRIAGNLFVPGNVTLKVRPGTRLTIAPDATLRIRGRLEAVGTEKQPICFTGEAERPWGNLMFENRGGRGPGDDSEAAQKPADLPKSRLVRCIVEHGRGIVMDGIGAELAGCIVRKNAGSGIAVRDTGCRITGCRIAENTSDSNGGGIYVYGSQLSFVENNEIVGNRARQDGGGVFAFGQHSNTAVNLKGNRIEQNACRGDGGGAWISRSSMSGNRISANRAQGKGGGIFSTFALIVDNRILGNAAGEGGGVYAETNSTLTGNRIVDNAARRSKGGGVYLNFWGMSIENETFRKNRVLRNRAEGPDPVGGIYLNGVMVFRENDIFANQGYQLYNGSTAGEPELTAAGCFWGTTDKQRIRQLIYDGEDDPGLAAVVSQPFADEAVAAGAGR